jgi:hypothetical protein
MLTNYSKKAEESIEAEERLLDKVLIADDDYIDAICKDVDAAIDEEEKLLADIAESVDKAIEDSENYTTNPNL